MLIFECRRFYKTSRMKIENRLLFYNVSNQHWVVDSSCELFKIAILKAIIYYLFFKCWPSFFSIIYKGQGVGDIYSKLPEKFWGFLFFYRYLIFHIWILIDFLFLSKKKPHRSTFNLVDLLSTAPRLKAFKFRHIYLLQLHCQKFICI